MPASICCNLANRASTVLGRHAWCHGAASAGTTHDRQQGRPPAHDRPHLDGRPGLGVQVGGVHPLQQRLLVTLTQIPGRLPTCTDTSRILAKMEGSKQLPSNHMHGCRTSSCCCNLPGDDTAFLGGGVASGAIPHAWRAVRPPSHWRAAAQIPRPAPGIPVPSKNTRRTSHPGHPSGGKSYQITPGRQQHTNCCFYTIYYL